MADTIIKRWNSTTSEWEELNPQTTHTQIVASGTPDSTTYLRGDGTWSTVEAGGGTITSVTAGSGLSGGGTTGDVTLNLDFSELTDITLDVDGTTEMVVKVGNTEGRKALSEIKLSAFNNDSGWTSNAGDITSVTAGAGLTGGGTSGGVSLAHADTSTQASLTALTGANVVSDIDVDGYGHVTSLATRAMTPADIGAASSSHTHTFASLTSKPTTLSGFGITDADTSTQVDTKISTAINNLVDTAPGTLDTLNELAAALGDDPNFATTVTNALAGKASSTNSQTVTLTGAVTGSGTITNYGNVSIATTATNDPTLTISGDGSGSATFTNLGNATLSLTVNNDSHEHTRLSENATITYGASYLQWNDTSGVGGTGLNGAAPSNPTNEWWHHLIMNHGNSAGYYFDIAAAFHSDDLYFRRNVAGSLQSWREIIHSENIGSQSVNYATSSGTSGSTTGNAATATTLQTARTINGTSFNGSANITTANWGTARTLTIGNTGKSVNGSGNVSWSLAEIGAQAAGSYASSSHSHSATEIVTGELNTARMGSGTATAGYVLKSDGDGTASWQVDNNTTYSLGSFGVTATAAELNALDGITATVTELNYTDGVTSNIQTQLDGKAASSHSHSANAINVGGISFIGKSTSGGGTTSELSVATAQSMLGLGSAAYTASTAYATASHTHPASAITSGTFAAARLGSGTANSSTYLRGDLTWASIPGGGITGDDTEWAYVGKSTDASTNTTITVDSTDLGSSFDWTNYDYKFVYQGSTTAEDSSSVTIYFDGDTTTADKYSFQYHRTQNSAETTITEASSGDGKYTGSIITGLGINAAASSGGFGTDLELEFTVRRTLTTGSGLYAFVVRGEGNAHYWPTTQSLTTAIDGMAQSRFVGSFRQDAGVSSVTINHGITVGGTDVNIVRVYRRRKF